MNKNNRTVRRTQNGKGVFLDGFPAVFLDVFLDSSSGENAYPHRSNRPSHAGAAPYHPAQETT
jgi:hypothetical protein